MKNMKMALAAILALLLLSACGQEAAVPTEAPSVTIPQQTVPTDTAPLEAAPDFTVMDAQGNPVKLSDFKGTPVVLNFWATWCPYCLEEMPDFERASVDNPNILFMMVNATDGVQETLETAQQYIYDNGYTFDVFYDTQLSAVNAFGITSFPSTFFIDSNGELLAYASGMLDAQSLEKGLDLLR